jgi:AMP-polyphosphate phosphotransferase
VLVKFWLHVSAEEQLERFQKREKNALKSWKITDEDWRNREKRLARVKVVETVIAEVECGMRERDFPVPG